MKVVESNTNLIAYCGLYCGACRSYLTERCPGCHENQKAGWCKIRVCCREQHLATCAECSQFPDPRGCRKFNNFVAKVFGVLLRSDRAACIEQIRQLGLEGHADNMSEHKRQSIRR